MAKVITAPGKFDTSAHKVYMGGAIDMGKAVNWQLHVIEALSDIPGITLLNPRREMFTPEMMDEQIRWELEALEKSEEIIMWFPAKAIAPVSFLETGIYLNSGRLILGVEDGFYRQRNLELTCEYYNVPLFHNLIEIVNEVLRRYTTH